MLLFFQVPDGVKILSHSIKKKGGGRKLGKEPIYFPIDEIKLCFSFCDT